MAKSTKVREVFVCRDCGNEQARWMGKCPDCGSWDSLESRRIDPAATRDAPLGIVETWSAIQREDGKADVSANLGAQRASEIGVGDTQQRLATRISELDRVLGGGLVVGSATLAN